MKPGESYSQFTSNLRLFDSKDLRKSQEQAQIHNFSSLQFQKCLTSKKQDDFDSFQNCFSPKETAQSLRKRNDQMKLLNFDNSDQDPDEIYNKRKQKVERLLTKEQGLIEEMKNIKTTNIEKYLNIIAFTKFISQIKESISGARTDYYSNKTFCAIKNSQQKDLKQLTKLLKKMYQKSLRISQKSTSSQSTQCKVEDETVNKIVQFLIIPRFLISKDKIQRLIKDEELQENFIFLVINKCLGHYNNEANKKMPEENHMKYVRELLKKVDGRQKFRRICSINHGSRLLKNHTQFYYELYNKNLEYLKYVQLQLKKRKKIQTIKKKLERISFQNPNEVSYPSQNQNQSSSCSVFSFGSFKDELGKIYQGSQEKSMQEQLIDSEPASFQSFRGMKKSYFQKLMSVQIPIDSNKQRRFAVKKSLTMEQKKTPTIILVNPPSQI